jgi:hypothetical protein
MSRRIQENIVAGFVLAFLLAIIVLSLDYSPRARFVPMPVAVFGVILVSIQLVWQNLRSPDELHVDVLELLTGRARNADGSGGETKAAARDTGPGIRKQVIAFGMVALLLVGFLLLGPIPSIFVFTAAYLGLTGYFPWPKSLVYAVVLTVIVVVVFGYVLQIPLDRSILLPGIGHYIGL